MIKPNTPTDNKLKLNEYKKLRNIFDQKDETGYKSIHEFGIDYKTTEVGIFLATETTILYQLFHDLVSSGFLDPRSAFLDAGSGDARVNHMAALNGFKKSIGIEYSNEILEKSKKQTKMFEDAKIIDKDSVNLIQGDFTKIETYTKNGLDIKKIKTYFNYLNGWKELLVFINNNSPAGTKIILVDEQFATSNRIINEIAKYSSIKLIETIKYIYYKNRDSAELLTPELLETMKKSDNSLEKQHIHVDITSSGNLSVIESDYRVVTVYLLEKTR